MGICFSTNALLKGRADSGKNKRITLNEAVSYIDIDLFEAAIQKCVAISAGVPVGKVDVLELARSNRRDGIKVLYSVSDLFVLTSEPEIKGQINKSIFSGEFSALLGTFGFPTASATGDIHATYIRVHASPDNGSLTLVVNQVINHPDAAFFSIFS